MTVFNTRIAPSPSGDFHLGTARTAYFNWLAARATGGKFLVRIDDTDANRSDDKYTDVIYNTLNRLGLNYDHTFKQSSRISFYQHVADVLCSKGNAIKNPDGSVVLVWKDTFPDHWVDELSGVIKITTDDVAKSQNIILLRSDSLGNTATYHFASVVDDIFNDINHIIRGVDHVTNTSRQIGIWTAICEAFGFSCVYPKFTHIGLIFVDGKKLSKRDGAASVLTYLDNDVHPEAILNFLLRLGWGPTIDDKSTSLLPVNRALELFVDGGKMKSGNANVDFLKLASFDRKYKGRDENLRRQLNKG